MDPDSWTPHDLDVPRRSCRFPLYREIDILAPISGQVVQLRSVDDPFWMSEGDGIAIIPTGNKLVAPADGWVERYTPKACVIMIVERFVTIIFQFGHKREFLDEGCKVLVSAGEYVKQGQTLMEFSPEYMSPTHGPVLSPIIAHDPTVRFNISMYHESTAVAGETRVMQLRPMS